jgi:sugar phosphate isomerase/epimerase
MKIVRRHFLQSATALGAAAFLPGTLAVAEYLPQDNAEIDFGFGLVTYLWGKDWDLETLISNCEKGNVRAVELRTTHAHRVEPNLTDEQRNEVAQRFAETDVVLVGIGSDERFDAPDPAKLKAAIEATKSFVRLSHDVGGSGVKVKPDSFHKDVPQEKTIEQIGQALNEVAAYGEGFGQQIRLEVHGGCAALPHIKAIMDVADHPNVAVCWNCNPQDLEGEGFEHNFDLVRDRFGQTVHVRELNDADYPYQKLFDRLVKTDYVGWVLLEARTAPEDPIAALKEQRALFDAMAAKAAKS